MKGGVASSLYIGNFVWCKGRVKKRGRGNFYEKGVPCAAFLRLDVKKAAWGKEKDEKWWTELVPYFLPTLLFFSPDLLGNCWGNNFFPA